MKIPTKIKNQVETNPQLLKLITDATPEFRSPILLEQLFWNVVIAFVVNVSASAVYDVLRDRLAKSRLGSKDVDQQSNLLNIPICEYDPSRQEAAITAAMEVFLEFGVKGDRDAIKSAILQPN